MPGKIRVLIVDDSAYSRQTIKGMLETDREIEVVGVATNGIEAMAKTVKLRPNVITLDFEMPEMDGFSFLRWLMKERPLPVIMVSSYADTKTVFKALELGAADFIAKPGSKASVELLRIRDDLVTKVKGSRLLNMDKLDACRTLIGQEPGPVEVGAESGRKESKGPGIGVVAIGASTGGPAALQVILTRLPADFPAALLISQHMPRGFTEPFAERLNRLCRIKVREAKDGVSVEPGSALICPGGSHMTLRGREKHCRVAIRKADSGDKYTPSVDLMMSAAAEHFGQAAMGVILTGMGNDGKQGVVEIKGRGGYTIAESDETAVVYGMPQEAIRTGSVDAVLPLDEIPKEITRVVLSEKGGAWKKTQG